MFLTEGWRGAPPLREKDGLELVDRFGDDAFIAVTAQFVFLAELVDAVADVGGEFELQVVGGLLHPVLEALDCASGLIVVVGVERGRAVRVGLASRERRLADLLLDGRRLEAVFLVVLLLDPPAALVSAMADSMASLGSSA